MHISDNKGQTLVETALILIFLMLIIIGIMEFGRAMYFKNTANNAARGIARIAVVTPGLIDQTTTVNCNSPAGGILVGTLTNADFCNRFVTITKGSVTVNIDIAERSGTDTAQTGDTVDASVTVPFETLTGIITTSPSSDPNAVVVNLSTLVGQASMRYE